jgi:hypothetical protein
MLRYSASPRAGKKPLLAVQTSMQVAASLLMSACRKCSQQQNRR